MKRKMNLNDCSIRLHHNKIKKVKGSKHMNALYIQCTPLILALLINMSKSGCGNKSALFILLIFCSNKSHYSNLSLK